MATHGQTTDTHTTEHAQTTDTFLVTYSTSGKLHQRPFETTPIADDITNMYNTTKTAAMFSALREHQPHLVPVYRIFYWQPSPIWLERSGGQLRRQSVTVDTDSIDSSLNDAGATCHCSSDAYTVDDPFLYACVGGRQGCPLATNGCILPHHADVLNKICQEYPDVLIVGDADDTYYNAPSSSVHAAFQRKRDLAHDACGHESNLTKVCAYSPKGDLAHKPDDYARVNVFKAVGGAYMGDPAAVTKSTTAKLHKKLKPLDNLERARDTEKHNNVEQLKRILLIKCAANQSIYTAQTTRPSLARPALAAESGRLREIWAKLVSANVTNDYCSERVDLAWHHRRPGAAARVRGRHGRARHARQGGGVLVRLRPSQLARAAAHVAALRLHRHRDLRPALLRRAARRVRQTSGDALPRREGAEGFRHAAALRDERQQEDPPPPHQPA